MSELIKSIVRKELPLLDVRSEIEFEAGSIPCSVNIPILNSNERAQVGICYKKHGQASAIELGSKLVNIELRQERIKAWHEFLSKQSEAVLFCARGGLRSQIAASWLKDTGLDADRIEGGYKAIRNCLLERLEHGIINNSLIVLSGKTGSGKTELLVELENIGEEIIDLEGMAGHRGSAFGALLETPSNQANFQNSLAAKLLKLDIRQGRRVFMEDESRLIGRNSVPEPLFLDKLSADQIIVDESLSSRAGQIIRTYVDPLTKNYIDINAEDFFRLLEEKAAACLAKIRKPLGGLRYQQVRAMLSEAVANHQRYSSSKYHLEWIMFLLKEYYDPRYSHQNDHSDHKVLFRGTKDEVLEYLSANSSAAVQAA